MDIKPISSGIHVSVGEKENDTFIKNEVTLFVTGGQRKPKPDFRHRSTEQ